MKYKVFSKNKGKYLWVKEEKLAQRSDCFVFYVIGNSLLTRRGEKEYREYHLGSIPVLTYSLPIFGSYLHFFLTWMAARQLLGLENKVYISVTSPTLQIGAPVGPMQGF